MMAVSDNDPEGLKRVNAFRKGLEEAGWSVDHGAAPRRRLV